VSGKAASLNFCSGVPEKSPPERGNTRDKEDRHKHRTVHQLTAGDLTICISFWMLVLTSFVL